MPAAHRSIRSGPRQSRCTLCNAPAGMPCVSTLDGQVLPGYHFQRRTALRRDIQAALGFYAGLGLRNPDKALRAKGGAR